MEGEISSISGSGVFTFVFSDEKAAYAAKISLEDEGNVGQRSSSTIMTEGSRLKVTIDADDIVSMRASLNGILRALQTFESIEKVV